jgi:hypothetical protein
MATTIADFGWKPAEQTRASSARLFFFQPFFQPALFLYCDLPKANGQWPMAKANGALLPISGIPRTKFKKNRLTSQTASSGLR